MSIISIEEIRTSSQLKKQKCNEAKEAIRAILSGEKLERFDGAFDRAVDKAFKGMILKEKSRDE